MIRINIVLVIILGVSMTTAVTSDFRVITYDDVLRDPNIASYSHDDIQDFAQIAIDVERNQLILGAMNYLVRLDLDSLRELEVIEWKPLPTHSSLCTAMSMPPETCNNYIRVLLLQDKKVYVCGTSAFYPQCQWRMADNLEEIEITENGKYKCPYNPTQNNTALLTSNGDFYSGLFTDLTSTDPAIYRESMGESTSRALRTVPSNSLWLNNPDFVSSYEIGNFVYFFFREAAVEYINCGKKIYSRVARVCKSDQGGGTYLLKDNWVTYAKARLNCSLPGDYPFYYDEVQSTYMDRDQGRIYMVFTTSPTSIYGSAVCAYTLHDLEEAFEGPYKYQENAQMAWHSVKNDQNSNECPAAQTKRSIDDTNATPQQWQVLEAQKFQLMDSAVQPVTLHPLVVSDSHRYTHIAVEHVKTKHHQQYEIIFVTTLEGKLRKMARLPNQNKTCLIEEIQIVPEKDQQPIRKLEISSFGFLILTTKNHVYRIPMERCMRFTTKSQCMRSQDPFCGWDENQGACTPIPEHLPAHYWHQNITTCPETDGPVDGGWSDWQTWTVCEQRTDLDIMDGCRCRNRICNNPEPTEDGAPCIGPSIEVTNCTVHGGWTPWSEWSTCSATCNTAVKTRTRSCGNPVRRNGGRVCVGPEIEEAHCADSPPCPVDGDWGAWSPWSQCSKKCGTGSQHKKRVCNNPAPQYDGQECVGDSTEWRECNTEICSAESKKALTPWIKTNLSSEGYGEQRYRVVCRAKVDDPDDITVNSFKLQKRYCPKNSNSCMDPDSAEIPNRDGGWTEWSTWTTCNQECGGGEQRKERTCTDPPPSGSGKDCRGHSLAIRECNLHSCQGVWSSWSPFTVCSRSCGDGFKIRTRSCEPQVRGRTYKHDCDGRKREEVPCKESECPEWVIWQEWSDWSVCSDDGTQHRRRKCLSQDVEICAGAEKEMRACDFNALDPNSALPKTGATMERTIIEQKYPVYLLAIIGILGFILGALVSVGLYKYYLNVRKNDREKHFSALSYKPHSSMPNIYCTLRGNKGSDKALNNKNFFEEYLDLQKGDNNKNSRQMTVNDAQYQYNSLLRSNSNMRTDLQNPEYYS